MIGEDDSLRVRALDALGPLGDALAREALEEGTVRVEPAVLTWEGSHGEVQGHRVVVVVRPALHGRLLGHPGAYDALTAALAAAISAAPGNALADLRVEAGDEPRSGAPYRGRP